MSKNCLWMLNHSTLMKSEIKILKTLNYKIYTPKKLLRSDQLSCNVNYDLDNVDFNLEDKVILDNFNFYEQEYDSIIKNLICKYFDIIILPAYANCFKVFNFFKKIVIIRAFGLHGNDSYANKLIKSNVYDIFLEKYNAYIGSSYNEVTKHEDEIPVNKLIYLPLSVDVKKDNWNGSINKILFQCSRISSDTSRINNFINNFKSFDYTIFGRQQKPINGVLNNVTDSDLANMYNNYKLLFYDSVEERHIHYTPIEAISCGMPVIYMNNGILKNLNPNGIGLCYSIDEAKSKINQILNNNTVFINLLKKEQRDLIKSFSFNRTLQSWKNSFNTIHTIPF